MIRFIQCIMAAISFETLLVYDFLCFCFLLNKEKLAEKLWKKFLPNREYKEEIFFVKIRPIFLQISMVTYLLSIQIISNIEIFNIILMCTPLITITTNLLEKKRTNRKKFVLFLYNLNYNNLLLSKTKL